MARRKAPGGLRDLRDKATTAQDEIEANTQAIQNNSTDLQETKDELAISDLTLIFENALI